MTEYMDGDGRVYDEYDLADEVDENHYDEFVDYFESEFDQFYNPTDVLRDYGRDGAYQEAFRDWLRDKISEDPDWVAAMAGMTTVGSRSRKPTNRVTSGQRKSTSDARKSSSRCVKKKTAASKPKTKPKTASNQRKSSSKSRSGATSGRNPVRRY